MFHTLNEHDGKKKSASEKKETSRRQEKTNQKSEKPSFKKKKSNQEKIKPPISPISISVNKVKKLKKPPKLITQHYKDNPEILNFITKLIQNAGSHQ